MKWSLLLFGLVALAGTAAACDGLSPGDLLQTDAGLCTLGFLVADADGLYFTTAGHCIEVEQEARNPDTGAFGRGAFSFLEPDNDSPQDGAPGMDFGLIRIHPDAYAGLNPKMCGWEGPTGIYNETPGGGMLQLYGHSLVFGDLGDLGLPTYRREGILVENTEDAFYFTAPSLMGDSGSAVLHESGAAMGVLTHLQVGGGRTSTNGGTTLERGFRLAAEAGFPDLRLVLMGEDPLAVLAELRGAPAPSEDEPPVAGTPAAPTRNSTARPTSPNGATPPPANATRPDDSIVPAEAGGEDAAEPPSKDTPFLGPAAFALAVGLALALALGRRR